MPDITFYPPSPMVWIMICTVAIVAIYFVWGRKAGKTDEESKTGTNP